MDRYEEAIIWFDKTLKINPYDFNSMRERGISLHKLGQVEESIIWYDKALVINPGDYEYMRERDVALSRISE